MSQALVQIVRGVTHCAFWGHRTHNSFETSSIFDKLKFEKHLSEKMSEKVLFQISPELHFFKFYYFSLSYFFLTRLVLLSDSLKKCLLILDSLARECPHGHSHVRIMSTWSISVRHTAFLGQKLSLTWRSLFFLSGKGEVNQSCKQYI